MGPINTADTSHARRGLGPRELAWILLSSICLASGLAGCSLGSGIDIPSAGSGDNDGDGELGDGDSDLPPEGVDPDYGASGGAGGAPPLSMGGGPECGLGGEAQEPTVMGATTCLR